MKRANFRLDLAYDGSAFAGFQQQTGLRTVESTIVQAVQPLVPSLRGLAVAGRTDRGVHATGQVASFWTQLCPDPDEIRERIDSAAPGELAALEVRRVSPSFHAQFLARARSYVYLWPDASLDPGPLDRMLAELLGTRCFSAFARDTPPAVPTVRTLLSAHASQVGAGIRFDFTGSGFLRRMVRVLVATAIREGERGAPSSSLLEICESRDRRRTAMPADPGGLTLSKISYDPIAR
jgi:tRNA pseudouridine38-40 synthase